MLSVFFNPYPGMLSDYETGKRCLLLTAQVCMELFGNGEFKAHDPEGNDSIKFFSLAEDNQGARYTPSSFVRKYSGRERELIKWFLRAVDKGSRVRMDDLSICEDWELSGLNVSAPVLEYALRQDGMAITISDDHDWRFLSKVHRP